MDSIKKLADLFAKFPTIGPRTAKRFVFYLLKLSEEKTNELILAIQELKNKIKFCSFCFNPHELKTDLCYICQDNLRNKQILCVVEKETDLISIENTKRYKGLYFVLDSSSLGFKINEQNLRLKELKERIENPQKFGLSNNNNAEPKLNFTEVIIAINTTVEGMAISILVKRALKELVQFPTLKITHLAKGLPSGGELEYADEETLESAFEGRK